MIEIIKKHNLTNEKVAIMNCPNNQEFVRFEEAIDKILKNNLILISNILKAELLKK